MKLALKRVRKTGLATLATGVALASAAQAGGLLDLYYERSLMAAAGARCNLFQPQLRAALEASAAQARNAALRSGRSETEVAAVRDEAVLRAQGASCASPDLTTAAARVRTAFDGWSHTTRVAYPGAQGGWTADRTVYRSPRWRLVESAPGGAAFGIAGDLQDPAELAAVLSVDGEAPYGARLKFRDAGRAPSPWLANAGAPQLPPAAALKTIFASEKSLAPAGLAQGAQAAVAFRFPATAALALDALDPRERFEIEFLFPGDRVRTAVFEVGDFAAGRAFLAMGPK